MGWCNAQNKMLSLCVKTIVKESRNFGLACVKKNDDDDRGGGGGGDFG